MSHSPPVPSRALAFAWLASLATLGVILINFLGALTALPWFAPLASLLAAQDTPDVAGGRWSRCVLLGDCVPGAFGTFGSADVGCLATLLICVGVVIVGARRIQHGSHAGAEQALASRAATRWPWLSGIGIGLILAGAAGTALEAAGVWTRLVVSPNLSAEQGAPVWVPWLMAAALIVAASVARRRVVHDCRHAASHASVCLVSALMVWSVAVVVHTSLPEPVQGRYYGLPGVVVGRSQNYEYGTYLGMIAPAVAGLCCLMLLVNTTRRCIPPPRRRPTTIDSRTSSGGA